MRLFRDGKNEVLLLHNFGETTMSQESQQAHFYTQVTTDSITPWLHVEYNTDRDEEEEVPKQHPGRGKQEAPRGR